MNTKIKKAAVTGLIPAILEGLLIYSVEPTISNWILAQSILFWFTCGFSVYLIDLEISEILKGIVYTVFLNVPWYIAESFAKEKPGHFIPLVAASIIQGLIIGLISKKFKSGPGIDVN